MWADLRPPHDGDLGWLREEFNLHPLAIEDASKHGQRPKLEHFNTHAFIVAYAADPRTREMVEVDLFVGENWLITVHERTPAGGMFDMDDCQDRVCRTKPTHPSSSFLFYIVLDAIVDTYFSMVDVLGEEVDALEERIFFDPDPETDEYAVQRDMLESRKRLLGFRRRVAPLREVLLTLLREDLPWMARDARQHLQDVFDHVMRVTEEIDMRRELVRNAVDAHLALASNHMNRIMKAMTSWGAILIVATVIAGVYGMNFTYMPELRLEVRLPHGARPHGWCPPCRCTCTSAGGAGSEPGGAGRRHGARRGRRPVTRVGSRRRARAGWPPVAGGVVAGVALRAVALSGVLGRTDSDEVLSGLMARHLAGDGWPVFLWGQSYGGSLELAPLSVTTTLFGANAVGLRLPVVVLAAVNCVLVWRVARRILPARQAQVAGLLSWLGPPAALWYGVREMLFYQPTVGLGLVTTLFVLRVLDDDDGGQVRDWAAAGLAAGLGFWTSPNVVYLVAPAAILLVVRRRRWWRPGAGRRVAVALASAMLGALPWIVHNLTFGFDSLHATSVFPVVGNYATRLGWFLWFGLPGALGAREMFTYDWILGSAGPVAGVAAVAVLVVAWRRGAAALQWDTIALVMYPLLFAVVPFGPDQPNMKYQFFLTPVLAVTLARLATSTRAAAALMAACVLVTGIGLSRIAAIGDAGGTPLLLPDLDEAIAVLDRRGVSAVWGDYWIVYRLDWLTGERIVGAPAVGIERYEPYERQVRAAERSAWVVERGRDEARLLDDLTEQSVGFEVEPAGAYVVVVPARPVLPEDLDPRRRFGR